MFLRQRSYFYHEVLFLHRWHGASRRYPYSCGIPATALMFLRWRWVHCVYGDILAVKLTSFRWCWHPSGEVGILAVMLRSLWGRGDPCGDVDILAATLRLNKENPPQCVCDRSCPGLSADCSDVGTTYWECNGVGFVLFQWVFTFSIRLHHLYITSMAPLCVMAAAPPSRRLLWRTT